MVGLEVLIFGLHYIRSQILNFLTRTQWRLKRLHFLGSRSKHQNRHHDCHATWIRVTDKHKMRTRLGFYHVLELSILVTLVGTTKKIIKMIFSWLPGDQYIIFRANEKLGPELQHACENVCSKEVMSFFHIKCKLLHFFYKTVDVIHS